MGRKEKSKTAHPFKVVLFPDLWIMTSVLHESRTNKRIVLSMYGSNKEGSHPFWVNMLRHNTWLKTYVNKKDRLNNLITLKQAIRPNNLTWSEQRFIIFGVVYLGVIYTQEWINRCDSCSFQDNSCKLVSCLPRKCRKCSSADRDTVNNTSSFFKRLNLSTCGQLTKMWKTNILQL